MSWLAKKVDEAKYAEFFVKLAHRWFIFLEWLIILGLLLYLRAITKSWYFYALSLFSFIIFSFYIQAVLILSPLRSCLLKIFPLKNSLIFGVISIAASIFCYFILSYIISDITISYIK